jgi:hypothetical protein
MTTRNGTPIDIAIVSTISLYSSGFFGFLYLNWHEGKNEKKSSKKTYFVDIIVCSLFPCSNNVVTCYR